MAIPAFVAAGTGDTDICDNNLTPTYPSVSPGDVAILAVVSRQAVTDSYTITDANGSWTLVASYGTGTAGAPRVFVYKRTCDGSEDGDAVTVHSNTGGSDPRHSAIIWSFSGGSGGHEGATFAGFSTGTTVSDDDVTTLDADRLVLQIVANNGSDASLGSFTGSVWTNRSNYAGGPPSIFLYTGSAPTPGVYGGQTITIGAARNIRTGGLALLPDTLTPEPAFSAAGTVDSDFASSDLTPAYPATVNAGDKAILCVASRQNVADSYTVTDANGGWALVTAYDSSGGAPRVFVYARDCAGDEDGDTVTVHSNTGGASVRHKAVIWTFSNAAGPVADAHFNGFSTGTTVSDDDVTTTEAGRLVVQIVVNNGLDSGFPDFSAVWDNESNHGGDTPSIYLYTASAPTPGVYGGATITLGSARNVRTGGFSLSASRNAYTFNAPSASYALAATDSGLETNIAVEAEGSAFSIVSPDVAFNTQHVLVAESVGFSSGFIDADLEPSIGLFAQTAVFISSYRDADLVYSAESGQLTSAGGGCDEFASEEKKRKRRLRRKIAVAIDEKAVEIGADISGEHLLNAILQRLDDDAIIVMLLND